MRKQALIGAVAAALLAGEAMACSEIDKVKGQIIAAQSVCGFAITPAGEAVSKLADGGEACWQTARKFAEMAITAAMKREKIDRDKATRQYCDDMLVEHREKFGTVGMKPMYERPGQTASAPDASIFNAGRHAGLVWQAVKACGGSISEPFKVAGGVFRARNEAEFQRGFKSGLEEGEDSHRKHGKSLGCAASLMLYGPNGVNIAGAWAAPK